MGIYLVSLILGAKLQYATSTTLLKERAVYTASRSPNMLYKGIDQAISSSVFQNDILVSKQSRVLIIATASLNRNLAKDVHALQLICSSRVEAREVHVCQHGVSPYSC